MRHCVLLAVEACCSDRKLAAMSSWNALTFAVISDLDYEDMERVLCLRSDGCQSQHRSHCLRSQERRRQSSS